MSENYNIIVADAESILRNQIQRILESEGYKVTPVASLAELQEKNKNDNFDILLLDLRITGLSSIEVIGQLKKDHPGMAIVVMIAANEAYILKKALKSGADEYIVRPFKSHEVSLIIKRTYWRLLSAKEPEKTWEKMLADG